MGGMGKKLDSLQWTLMRKIRPLEFKNIHLIEGYEESEAKYKTIRDSVSQIDTLVRVFANYEHGGALYKNLKEGMQYLNNKASLGFSQNADMYERVAKVGEKLAGDCPKKSGEAEKYKKGFSTMSSSKKEFNKKADEILSELKKARKAIREVDDKRRETKNLRYCAEQKAQDSSATEDQIRKSKREYQDSAGEALEGMKDFVKNTSLGSLIKDLVHAYRKHLEECVSALKQVE